MDDRRGTELGWYSFIRRQEKNRRWSRFSIQLADNRERNQDRDTRLCKITLVHVHNPCPNYIMNLLRPFICPQLSVNFERINELSPHLFVRFPLHCQVSYHNYKSLNEFTRHYTDLDGVIMPGSEIQPEIMQPTASFHYFIPEALFPISYFVFDQAIPFHATNSMFDPYSDCGNEAVVCFVVGRQRLTPRFLFGLDHRHTGQSEALKAGILIQGAVFRQAVVGFISGLFIMFFAFTGQA